MEVEASILAPVEAPYRWRWWTLAVLFLSLLVVLGGNSNVNVVIPRFSRDLHATTSQLQWVVAAYSLAFASLLFAAGAIGDRFGRKAALQLGLVAFGVGALLAAAASDMSQLIAYRALMGAAAAFIMPSTLSIVVNVFPTRERPRAIALWAGFTGVAGTIGPVISGWLLGRFWYGSVFLVNIPIIALALISGWFLVPSSRDPERAPLDVGGTVLSSIGISALVYGIIEAPEAGWRSRQTFLAFAVAVVLLTLFVMWELRIDQPMLDMRYFANPAFSTGTGGTILVFLALFGMTFLLTQYFQLVLGYSPLSASVRFLPATPVIIIVSWFTPRLSRHFGANRTVAFGMILVALGLLMFRATGLSTPYTYILAALAPLVFGISLVMAPMTAAIMSAVPARRAGAGSAMNDASREFGAALGVAVLGSAAASRFGPRLDGLMDGVPPSLRDAARASLGGALDAADRLTGPAGQALSLGARSAFVDGFRLAVTIGAALASVAAVLVYRYLPRDLPPEPVATEG